MWLKTIKNGIYKRAVIVAFDKYLNAASNIKNAQPKQVHEYFVEKLHRACIEQLLDSFHTQLTSYESKSSLHSAYPIFSPAVFYLECRRAFYYYLLPVINHIIAYLLKLKTVTQQQKSFPQKNLLM